MITVEDLQRIRKSYVCEWCRLRRGVERHHCLIHDTKRFHDVLTVEENLMLACPVCHTQEGILNSQHVRAWFWSAQCKRYGESHMLEWLESLPDKLKWSRRVDFVKSVTN